MEYCDMIFLAISSNPNTHALHANHHRSDVAQNTKQLAHQPISGKENPVKGIRSWNDMKHCNLERAPSDRIMEFFHQP